MNGVTGQPLAGRYLVFQELGAGGMGAVHIGVAPGPFGISRAVAVKRLHPALLKDPSAARALADEARVAARVHHPNVVELLDVVVEGGEIALVMEYVPGPSLSEVIVRARKASARMPAAIAAAIGCDLLRGLHAAHHARSASGDPLGLVHRDVSPSNVLLGGDGIARVLDFGIASATSRTEVTRDGALKGKMGYVAPERLRGAAATRQSDLFSAGVVLWELVALRPLFAGDNDAVVAQRILSSCAPSLVDTIDGVDPDEGARLAALDAVIAEALAQEPERRFPSAQAMVEEMTRACAPASPEEVARWLEGLAPDLVERRLALARGAEQAALAGSGVSVPPPPPSPPAAPAAGDITKSEPRSRSHARASRRRTWILVAAVSALAVVISFVGLRSTSALVPVEHARVKDYTPKARTEKASMRDEGAPPVDARPRRPSACNPPYDVVNGIKRYKPSCVH